MSEMVERVAKAIHNAEYNGDGEFHWSEVSADIYRRAARAAIASMREPTEDMIANEGDPTERVHWDYNCHVCGGHKLGWQAMIDAALKE